MAVVRTFIIAFTIGIFGSAPSSYADTKTARSKFIRDWNKVVNKPADLSGNTIVVYTSDQGFFLGEHGWFDKRFIYEESFQMPFLVRYPAKISPGQVNKDICCNVDFAPTFLDYADTVIHLICRG